MSILVIAEHDNAALKGATLNTVTAAAKIGANEALSVKFSGDKKIMWIIRSRRSPLILRR